MRSKSGQIQVDRTISQTNAHVNKDIKKWYAIVSIELPTVLSMIRMSIRLWTAVGRCRFGGLLVTMSYEVSELCQTSRIKSVLGVVEEAVQLHR